MRSKIPKRCDVLVIGGGPGGAIASSLLAQKNIDVVVLEKKFFPREAVGESLIPHFWRYLDLMGVSEEISNAGFIAKAGGSTYWDGKFRKMSFADFGFKRPGLHVERAEFDDILLNRAKELGAKVFHEIEVTKILHADKWSQINYKEGAGQQLGSIEAKFVVDATGQSAVIAKQEKIREYDEGFRFHAFWGYYKGGDFLDKDAVVRSFGEHRQYRPLTIVSAIGDWGWVWQILLKEKTSVGLILPRGKMKKFKESGANMTERFQSFVRDTPITGRLMEDAQLIPDSVGSIKDYAYKPSKLTIGNTFLIGDAAAFVDPINSAGVIMALYGGFLAAWSIGRALNKPDRIENIKEMFDSQLRLRLDLFRLLAYPSNLVTPKMMAEGRRILDQLDDKEKHLAMTQVFLTSRAKNLPELLGNTFNNYCDEMELNDIFR